MSNLLTSRPLDRINFGLCCAWHSRTLTLITMAAVLVTAASAQSSSDQQFADEIGDSGTSSTPLLHGFQLVSFSTFRTGVQNGAIQPVSYNILLQQVQARIAKDAANQTIVANYLRDNPQLTSLAQIIATDPQPSKTVVPVGGNWRIQLPNGTSVITQGRSDKLTAIASTIVTSADPAVQLKLYTDIYNALPQPYLQLFSTSGLLLPGPPTPASLANASLPDIQTALHSLTSDWQRIGSFVGTFPILEAVPCGSEVGAGTSHQTYGDRLQAACNSTPSPNGIFANFQFPMKPYLSCVKWQGNRNTCHIFANTSAVEMLIAENHFVKVNLSEQDFMDHYRLEWYPDFYNDGGSVFESAQGAIDNQYSFAYENQWDYNSSLYQTVLTSRLFPGIPLFFKSCISYPEWCSDTAPQAPVICAPFNLHLYCGFYSPPLSTSGYQITEVNTFWDFKNPDAAMNALVLQLELGRGVTMGLHITPNFNNAGSNAGFVLYDTQDAMNTNGDHLVHIVGFISDQDLHAKLPNAPSESGNPWFIIKNSWSPCWGDAGYGYLSWDYIKNQTNGGIAIAGVN